MNAQLRNTIVTASAGTGKTYRLVSEFVNSVIGSDADPIAPRRILALTFTEKAAAEMKTRISDRLVGTRYVRDLDQAHVATYHSFCARILRDYASIAGVDANFQLMDPFEEEELAAQVAKKIILTKLENGDASVQSLVARLHLSGLATNLLQISQELVESGQRPDLLPESFAPLPTELCRSQELIKLLARSKDALLAYDNIWESLNPAARERIAKARSSLAQLSAVIAKTEPAQLEIQISAIFSTLREQLGGRFGPDAVRKEALAQVSALGTLLCESFLRPECDAFKSLLVDFWIEFAKAKQRIMSLGFSDLLVLTRDLLRENLAVRSELKARFDRVLVDEYQDTSPIQEDIVALLCEATAESQALDVKQKALDHVLLEPGKLFVVGDPKQSIYGFRGSDVALFDRMARAIIEQGGACESLNISRRSSPLVIAVVNQAVECGEREKLVPLREDHGLVSAILKGDEAITSQVVSLIEKGVRPGQIAILVRRIKKAAPILQNLRAANIPASIFGGEGFFECQEIVELVAALRLVIEPEHSVSLLTILRSPLIRFDDFYWPHLFAALKKESGFAPTVSDLLTVASSDVFPEDVRKRINVFLTSYSWIFSGKSTISAVEAFEKLLQTNDYYESLSASAEANVDKLRGILIDAEGDFETQVRHIMRRVARNPKEALAQDSESSDAVQIMTIHQSKGLEFPAVILADMSAAIPSDSSELLFDDELGLSLSFRGRPIAVCAPEGTEWVERFPTRIQAARSRQRSKNEAELSRLLYVALTRARDQVFIVDDQKRDEEGRVQQRGKTLLGLFNAQGPYDLPLIEGESSVALPAQAGEPVMPAQGSTPGRAGIHASRKLAPRRMFFASDIFAIKTEPQTRAERLNFSSPGATSGALTPSERGTLCHQMIRMAAEQLAVEDYADPNTVHKVLGAASRVLGRSEGDQDIIADCIATLESVIWPLLTSEFEIRFEVPMLFEDEGYVIKGFADVVATRGDIACLIDFKSSREAADSDKTKIQLLSYCAAISEDYSRIFYASHVIGSAETLNFLAFDDDSFNCLKQTVNDVLDT